MRNLKIQSIRRYLQASKGLHDQTRALQRLDAIIFRQLPSSLRAHCRLANVREHTLVLSAESPAWASKLRFCARQLLEHLQHDRGLDIRALRVIIDRPAASTRPRQPQRGLSRQSAELIRQAAGAIDDNELQSALLRLAGRTKRPTR